MTRHEKRLCFLFLSAAVLAGCVLLETDPRIGNYGALNMTAAEFTDPNGRWEPRPSGAERPSSPNEFYPPATVAPGLSLRFLFAGWSVDNTAVEFEISNDTGRSLACNPEKWSFVSARRAKHLAAPVLVAHETNNGERAAFLYAESLAPLPSESVNGLTDIESRTVLTVHPNPPQFERFPGELRSRTEVAIREPGMVTIPNGATVLFIAHLPLPPGEARTLQCGDRR